MAFMRPFLKNSILAALLVAATCAAAQPAGGAPASDEPSAREATDRRIARLDEAIRQVELTRNRLMWNTYLDYVEQGRITPDVMDYPGLDYERLRDLSRKEPVSGDLRVLYPGDKGYPYGAMKPIRR